MFHEASLFLKYHFFFPGGKNGRRERQRQRPPQHASPPTLSLTVCFICIADLLLFSSTTHSLSFFLSQSIFLYLPGVSLAAAKAKGGGAVVAAAGPIPFLPFTHNQILHAVNLGSLPAWISLVFLPRWRHTKTITLAIAVAYSVMYVMLAYVLFSKALFAIDPMAFSTTEGLSRMFAESTSVLAGWAHFIVFDLWTARYFVLDSGRANIPHLAVVPCILGCMFFGPLGLLTYVTVKKVFQLLNNRDPLSTKTFNF